ncbi:hypothetical protein EYF80_009811 [Liparis tanakae]|uniref:Uncharacterized protein n=1 Tax=Liparis tanakae TaxID=230148 RepID=A0A4Z2IS27_9TELE|nr:hypothetical protein EYF80_009811 [Liparis tanakae]
MSAAAKSCASTRRHSHAGATLRFLQEELASDRGYIQLSSGTRLMEFDVERNDVDFCFQKRVHVSLERSGQQTQTVDLSREEGVEDEDDRLRTRVEVQLLEEKEEQKEQNLKKY